MKRQRSVEQDADMLQSERDKLARKQAEIVKEQEHVIEASNKGIDRINSDIKALKRRLEVYANENPRKMNPKYHDLKEQYVKGLQDRAVLENARTMAEESISAAKLQRIPGEGISDGA